MRKIIVLLVVVVLMTPLYAYAGEDFIEYADTYFAQVCDNLAEKQSYVLSASGTSPDVGEIMFDFTEGNKTLLAIADDKCKVYAFFEDDELLGILYRMITVFQDMENNLSQGKHLEYKVRLSDENTIILNASNISSILVTTAGEKKPTEVPYIPTEVPATPEPTLVPEPTQVPEPTATLEPTVVPSVAGKKTVFLPSYMIDIYNDNIGSFFEVTSDADHSLYDVYFHVSLQEAKDGKLIYANSDSMIKIIYHTSDPNTIADEMTFWTSHKYDYRNIPQFCFAWAVVSNFVDDIYDIDFFMWLNGAKNGDTFSCDAFSAVYVADPDNYSSFVLTRK